MGKRMNLTRLVLPVFVPFFDWVCLCLSFDFSWKGKKKKNCNLENITRVFTIFLSLHLKCTISFLSSRDRPSPTLSLYLSLWLDKCVCVYSQQCVVQSIFTPCVFLPFAEIEICLPKHSVTANKQYIYSINVTRPLIQTHRITAKCVSCVVSTTCLYFFLENCSSQKNKFAIDGSMHVSCNYPQQRKINTQQQWPQQSTQKIAELKIFLQNFKLQAPRHASESAYSCIRKKKKKKNKSFDPSIELILSPYANIKWKKKKNGNRNELIGHRI